VWDWQGAEDDIRRSLDVRNSASGMQAAARLATIRGRLTEAEPILLKVLALDPLDTYTLQELAIWVYPGLGRFEEADRVYVKLKDLNPSYDWFNGGWAILKALQGNYPEALRLAQADPEPEAKEAALAIAYSGMGKPDQAKQALERLLKIPTASAYNIASVHAYRGEKDLAFRSLEAAYREREPDLVALKFDPLLESLRNDPRYNALVRRMNLPESP